MKDKVYLAVHSFRAWYSDNSEIIDALISLNTSMITFLALLAQYIRIRSYKTNTSNQISPVVHSSGTWYGNSFNTAPRIALVIAAATFLLATSAHRLGVEYSNILNTAILIAVGIAGLLLSFYVVPLSKHSNYKTNISSEISPVVHSSSVEHGDNKPPLLSGIRYHTFNPFHYLGLASRCPRPRMIARA